MDHCNAYALEFPSSPSNVSLVEPYVNQVLGDCTVSEDTYGNILVCLTEAVANAIFHGNCSAEAKKVRLSSERSENILRVRVEDEGCGFDPNNLPDPTSPENILKPGGRGVFLMRQLCNGVRFRRKGSVVEMTFEL